MGRKTGVIDSIVGVGPLTRDESEQTVEEDAEANHTSESRIASVVEPDDTNLANPALAYTSQSGQTGDPSEVEAYFFKRSISAPSRASLASMFSYPRSKW